MTELNTNILAIAPQLGLLLLVLGLGTVAYWREDSWLYLIAGLAICFYGIAVEQNFSFYISFYISFLLLLLFLLLGR